MTTDQKRQRKAKVLTVSDGVSAGVREDSSGVVLVNRLEEAGFEVLDHRVVCDGLEAVADALVGLCEEFAGLVVTTGGTGFGPRDQTPEGTLAVLDRQAPGLAEAMRMSSPFGRLSRAVAGTRGDALILNTPGSPKGAIECLESIIDVLDHALGLMIGADTPHPEHAPHADHMSHPEHAPRPEHAAHVEHRSNDR